MYDITLHYTDRNITVIYNITLNIALIYPLHCIHYILSIYT